MRLFFLLLLFFFPSEKSNECLDSAFHPNFFLLSSFALNDDIPTSQRSFNHWARPQPNTETIPLFYALFFFLVTYFYLPTSTFWACKPSSSHHDQNCWRWPLAALWSPARVAAVQRYLCHWQRCILQEIKKKKYLYIYTSTLANSQMNTSITNQTSKQASKSVSYELFVCLSLPGSLNLFSIARGHGQSTGQQQCPRAASGRQRRDDGNGQLVVQPGKGSRLATWACRVFVCSKQNKTNMAGCSGQWVLQLNCYWHCYCLFLVVALPAALSAWCETRPKSQRLSLQWNSTAWTTGCL